MPIHVSNTFDDPSAITGTTHAFGVNDTDQIVGRFQNTTGQHGFLLSGGTNGLLRQYFPRGTDLSRFSQAYLNKIALRLNQRPRKTLGFETPADRLRAVLQ
jgi:hypothetical protein